ncbi:MAG: tetratricopeptide repeat protein, partial [Elusimicrobia bacterium]|nr:tetratricopeptide repeat protein [Elusimicrobiota bacterium]
TVSADRYGYLPSVGILFLISALICRIKPKFAKWALIFGCVAAMSCETGLRSRIWSDDILLWNDAIDKYPAAQMAYVNRGNAYQKREEYEKSAQDYKKAIEIKPVAFIFNHLGTVYAQMEKFPQAIANFKQAARLDPSWETAYNNLGNAYMRMWMIDQAERNYRVALKLAPSSSFVKENMEKCLKIKSNPGGFYYELMKADLFLVSSGAERPQAK